MSDLDDEKLAAEAVGGDPRALMKLLRGYMKRGELPPSEPLVLPEMPATVRSDPVRFTPGMMLDVVVVLPMDSRQHDFLLRGVSLLASEDDTALDQLPITMFTSHDQRQRELIGAMLFWRRGDFPTFTPAWCLGRDLLLARTSTVRFTFENPLDRNITVTACLHGDWAPIVPEPLAPSDRLPLARVLDSYRHSRLGRCRFCNHVEHSGELCGEPNERVANRAPCTCRGG